MAALWIAAASWMLCHDVIILQWLGGGALARAEPDQAMLTKNSLIVNPLDGKIIKNKRL